MLFVVLSIIAGIGLLISIVWVLHKYQQKENAESVDRTAPLPPLELRESGDDELTCPEEILGLANTNATAPMPSAKPQSSSIAPAHEQGLDNSKSAQADDDFAVALASCRSALPQIGAFRQSCLILRAQIRALKKTKQDTTVVLEQLYHLAAMAEFFHPKASKSKALSPNASKKIAYDEFAQLSTPYNDLGYEHLNLLTKTDIKWMTQVWGEPSQHARMCELHPQMWYQLQNASK